MRIVFLLLTITFHLETAESLDRVTVYTCIWNPDHMDKNLQIGTYGSVHGTDMYVHVHVIMYKYKHVCTYYVHVHKYTYMYIHVHEFRLMYVHGTYMYMRLYLCMYMLQTCTYTLIYVWTLYRHSGISGTVTLPTILAAGATGLARAHTTWSP